MAAATLDAAVLQVLREGHAAPSRIARRVGVSHQAVTCALKRINAVWHVGGKYSAPRRATHA